VVRIEWLSRIDEETSLHPQLAQERARIPRVMYEHSYRHGQSFGFMLRALIKCVCRRLEELNLFPKMFLQIKLARRALHAHRLDLLYNVDSGPANASCDVALGF
jgi:hypothetical protein